MRDYKREAIRHWSKDPCGSETSRAGRYTRQFFDEVERYRYEVYAPWFKQLVPFSNYRGKRLLEIGVGMGTDHLQFARGGAQCYGIDLTPTSVDISRRRFKIYGEKWRLLVTDAENLPFATASFDVVYTFGVLHHTPDIGKAANEIFRVLRPGGETWVGLYHRYSAFFLIQTLLVRGILRGQLFKMDYRKFLARIESSRDGERREATVLVRLFSKRNLLEVFSRFCEPRIYVRHLFPTMFYPLHRLVSETAAKKLEPHLGWYIWLHAKKPLYPQAISDICVSP
jgi:ubiquinone/menaquinone biosynthesis C-methylase UbiE